MLTTVCLSRPKGPLRAVPGITNNRKISGRLRYCDSSDCLNVRLSASVFEPDFGLLDLPSF